MDRLPLLCVFLTISAAAAAVMTETEKESAEETVNHSSFEIDNILAEQRKRCPLCDSSVYGYCSDKLLHDACCCLDPYNNQLPQQCRYADCSFLHANSCDEHHLITTCCCSRVGTIV